ncbi:hypothetical protein BaRGS_00035313 [Batillaria attramentaria]|uniref:Uncharacterized protein n=1 Tax=Batillaria attramentaria TaxID=370345 RepID=A0ABD0JEW6_9CAEN
MSAEPRIENLDEFDEAEVLSSAFCKQMTEEEFEEQTSAETQKALDELCQYLQGNPEDYFRIIRKRKQEEMESAGIFSYLKVKMMGLLHGERYPACLVSPQQSTEKLEQLKADMQKAFTYSEESKGRRCSKRIASRTAQLATLEDKENTPLASTQSTVRRTRLATADKTDTPTMQASCSRAGSARVPPRRQKVSPTHQLTDGCGERVQHGSSGSRATSPASLCSSPSDTEFVTPEADVPVKNKKHKRTLSSTSTGSLTSMSSLTSVHSELMSSNPITRLRSTQIARSPGGTPLRMRNGPPTPQEPLHKALVTVLREKFKNVRTPSPLAANSTTAFSPDRTANSSLNATFSP